MNRIIFKGNPWPEGHAIEDLGWFAKVDPDTGLWFHLHLSTEEYNAGDEEGDEDEADENSEEESERTDWTTKAIWNNYHCCVLSSEEWDHKGFLVATEAEPLDLSQIGQRTFHVDPLPPPRYILRNREVTSPFLDYESRAFGIYLLGHDGVAEHKIRITPSRIKNRYNLDWRGQIAQEYVGSDTFDQSFHAQSSQLTFSGIAIPIGVDENTWRVQASRFLVGADALKLVQDENGQAFLVP